MSIVSSIFSARHSSRINARIAFFMDNLFAIAFGLGLRFIVDSVSHHDFKLTGTLVGLWEGVVTLHFVKKMPKSSDPYVAYIVRLFIDFLITESLARMVLVLVWTGLGMVLADIAPAVWADVGGRRVWRRFRRDLYYISRSLPSLSAFPRTRVVRFSPTIEPAEVSETMSTLSPSAVTPTVASRIPTTEVIPPTPAPPRVQKRPVPGGLAPSVVSETDTDLGSVLGFRQGATASGVGTAHHRLSVYPRRLPSDTGTPVSSATGDLDDETSTSSGASSASTETPSQAVEIQDEAEEVARSRHKGKERAVEKGDSTPTQRAIELPPTPSDSNRPHPQRTSIVPTISGMPSIPDFFESGLGSDWETIHKEDALLSSQEKDPSPPPRFVPPPVPSSFGNDTPRPSHFDQDLWDSVSNAAPPEIPQTLPMQRTTRPSTTTTRINPPTTSIRRKTMGRNVKPPVVPATPVYGDTWDTEQDQLPPQTPSVVTGTPFIPSTPFVPPDLHSTGALIPDVNQTDTVGLESQKPLPPEPEHDTNQQEGFQGDVEDYDIWNKEGLESRGEQPQDHGGNQDQEVDENLAGQGDVESQDRQQNFDLLESSAPEGGVSLLNQQQHQPTEAQQQASDYQSQPAQTRQTPIPHRINLFDDIAQQIADLGGGPTAGLEETNEKLESKPKPKPKNGRQSSGNNKTSNNANGDGQQKVGNTEGNSGQGGKGKKKEEDIRSDLGSSVSSATTIPDEAKERNKKAIIIRAQIADLEERIEQLKEDKVKAQGKEELDPLLEESVLAQTEIEKAERSLQKLTRKAEKIHEVAKISTGQPTPPKATKHIVDFEYSPAEEAVANLEGILGLFFTADRKTIGLLLSVPKGGPGKAMMTSLQRLLDEYGIKAVHGIGRMTITVPRKSYLTLLRDFRQQHSKLGVP